MMLAITLSILSAMIASAPSTGAETEQSGVAIECQNWLSSIFFPRAQWAERNERLLRAPRFQAYLKKIGKDWLTLAPDAKQMILETYLRSEFHSLQEADVDAKEARFLARSLESHGLDANESNARSVLEAVSRANVTRILGFPISSEGFSNPEIEHAVETFSFEYNHNFNKEWLSANDTPLLSSLAIEEITGMGGTWSTHEFTKNFMRQDGNLYFGVNYGYFAGSRGAEFYGGHHFLLEPEYARKHGWISYYVMTPDQLFDAGTLLGAPARSYARLDPSTRKEFATLKTWAADFAEREPSLYAEAAEIKSRLSHFDFTVTDFEDMIRRRLRKSLIYLSVHDPVEYRVSIEILKVRSAQDFPYLLESLVFKPLGIPSHYELKVPLRIPHGALRYFPANAEKKSAVDPEAYRKSSLAIIPPGK